jgi:CPA2 family monovalent cation:H+ antiporter-2
MTDIPSTTLFNFFLFLLIPFFFGYLAKKIKISPLVGYIFGGLILGNLFENIISKTTISNFAYFGIILLLFTLGLEVNFGQIVRLRRFIVIGGVLQLLISIIFIFFISFLFGFSPINSFLIGVALSSSSTSLVAKIIQDRGEENTLVGEIALGILMFQNLAFIPFLFIFTLVTSRTISFLVVIQDIVLSVIKASLIIFVLYYFGQKIIPKLFNQIAKVSRELLNLFIILFIFFVTYLSTVLQIPILIGVFIAGILVSQTLEHYHIFSQVRPLRDLLAVVFFVFMGVNIKLPLIYLGLPKIVFFSFLVIVIKAVVILIIFLALRFHSRSAFSLALLLFQIDEDAFILMFSAFGNGVVNFEDFLFVNISILLTLILTPIVVQNKDKIYQLIRKLTKKYLPFLEDFIKYRIDRDLSPIDVLNLSNHVVICGYGRIGGEIGRALMMANIPFVAIDYNFHIVEKAKKQGINIIYGDPGDIDVLDYAEVDNAAILISAVPEKFSQEAIVLNAKKLNPKIYVITRIHQRGSQRRLKDLGVDLVIQPEFEASLSIIKKTFFAFGLSREEILAKLQRLKMEHGMG